MIPRTDRPCRSVAIVLPFALVLQSAQDHGGSFAEFTFKPGIGTGARSANTHADPMVPRSGEQGKSSSTRDGRQPQSIENPRKLDRPCGQFKFKKFQNQDFLIELGGCAQPMTRSIVLFQELPPCIALHTLMSRRKVS